jgi:hypothetical protein
MNNVLNRLFLPSAMSRIVIASFAAAVLFTGCLGGTTNRPNESGVGPSPAQLGPPAARIVSLNSEHDFVVIDYTSQMIPDVGTTVNIYRNGKKVGAVRITEPVRAQFATADIVEGEVHVGDEAR